MSNNLKPNRYFIYDAHVCPPFTADKNLSGLERYKQAGISFVSINAGFGDMLANEIIPILVHFQNFLLANSDKYHLVKNGSDIDFCQQANKLGVAFDLEGANSLNGKIEMLDEYKQLGVRQLLLAYNKNNRAAGGCQDVDSGLTSFGKGIIKHMNEIGMLIDCSHTGRKTTLDIMDCSSQPVVFSHANPLALCDHPRNITDEQIKVCAEIGGVIGISGISIFLGCKNPTAARLVEHIDHVAQLVGVNHVGIGLDYVLDHNEVKALVKANPSLFPESGKYDEVELYPPEKITEISNELEKRGYKDINIQAVLGANFLRIAKQVWK